jgi:hypothetical protein
MDRKRKIEKISNMNGRVSKISNLQVDPRYIHPDYMSEQCDGMLTETGKLEILKLVPKSGAGPYFIARWDQVPEELDFDMHNAAQDCHP